MKYREKFSHYTDGRPYFFHQTVVAEGHRELLYAHWHPEMEILWICSGAMEFYAEHQHFHLEKGDYMILPPSRIHYGLSDHGRACSFCAFVFTPTWLFNTQNWPCQEKYLLPFLYHGQESTLCLRADSIRNQSIFDELQQIFSFSKTAPEICELDLMAHLLFLWKHLFSVCFQPQEHLWNHASPDDRISGSIDYIHQNYTQDITLELLADRCCLSREHYSRCFKRFTGFSPFDYLNRYRVMQSCLLLQNTTKKIAEVAMLSGFNNVSYYNRQFLRWIGATPSAYRAMHSTPRG